MENVDQVEVKPSARRVEGDDQVGAGGEQRADHQTEHQHRRKQHPVRAGRAVTQHACRQQTAADKRHPARADQVAQRSREQRRHQHPHVSRRKHRAALVEAKGQLPQYRRQGHAFEIVDETEGEETGARPGGGEDDGGFFRQQVDHCPWS